MNLAFYPQFVDPILEGKKLHTFRKDEANLWHPGMSIEMTTPKAGCNQHIFHRAKCIHTNIIEIKHYQIPRTINRMEIIIDKVLIGFVEYYTIDDLSEWSVNIRELSENDGFKSLVEFCQYYKEDYKGKIIHWTPLRYY